MKKNIDNAYKNMYSTLKEKKWLIGIITIILLLLIIIASTSKNGMYSCASLKKEADVCPRDPHLRWNNHCLEVLRNHAACIMSK